MPRAFSDREKELIRQRLLGQGQKQFAAYGLKKTSVQELAAAAGISKGAFYLFYESKEALLMDVLEQAEQHLRREVLAVVDQAGPSPRARLSAVLKKAFSLARAIPIFNAVMRSEYDLLFRDVPGEKLREHVFNDFGFIQQLVERCRQAGLPIQVPVEKITGLMYACVFVTMHEDDMEPYGLPGTLDVLLELIAAFCLGEITIQPEIPTS
jgi:AcrR family transcriptional regulator